MRRPGGIGLVIVALLLQDPANAATDERDPAFIADRLIRAIQKEIPAAKVKHPEPTSLDVEIGEHTLRLNLDNLVRQCGAPPVCDAAIESIVENLKSATVTGTAKEELKASNLRLTLHDRAWLDEATRQMGKDGSAGTRLVTEPLIADLHVVYVHDLPRGMRLIQERDLQTLGLDRPRLKEISRRNLAAQFRALPAVEEVGSLGVWVNSEDEDYAASLLVLPELWAPLARRLGQPLVVAVPVRNHFLVTRGDSEEHLVTLGRLTRVLLAEDSHPLSTTLLEWTPAGFREWKPGARDGGR